LRSAKPAIIMRLRHSRRQKGQDVAEIFVSYTSSDRDWAAWIGHELIALGHTPHIHE
jgi:hypothetical protein